MPYFDVSDVNLIGFSGNSHLENHMNYLFRTDAGQKWTNADTKLDTVLHFESDVKIGHWFFPEGLLVRRQWKEQYKKYIGQYYGADSLFMIRMECMRNDIYHFNRGMVIELFHFMRTMKNDNELELMCTVIHEDQPKNFCHFHMLVGDRSKRKS